MLKKQHWSKEKEGKKKKIGKENRKLYEDVIFKSVDHEIEDFYLWRMKKRCKKRKQNDLFVYVENIRLERVNTKEKENGLQLKTG